MEKYTDVEMEALHEARHGMDHRDVECDIAKLRVRVDGALILVPGKGTDGEHVVYFTEAATNSNLSYGFDRIKVGDRFMLTAVAERGITVYERDCEDGDSAFDLGPGKYDIYTVYGGRGGWKIVKVA